MFSPRQLQYLEAMEIQAWQARPGFFAPAEPGTEPATVVEEAAPATAPEEAPALPTPEPSSASEFGHGPPPEWDEIPFPDEHYYIPGEEDEEELFVAPPPPPPLTWEGLEAGVAGCTACPELVANRSRTVFARGDRSADWMVVGEAPGRDEDRLGEPFVGRAGKLLDEMLLAAGFERDKVFIANILKCRPPNNRDPKPEEAAKCRPFLLGQIELVKPRIILAVGRVAAQNLLDTSESTGRLRGKAHDFRGIPVVVTYHPAYLLRSPQEKRRAWEDLKLALRLYRQGR